MYWLLNNVTETITVAEAIWTGVGVLGTVVCLLLAVARIRTLRELYVVGINGNTRLIAWLRAFRAVALGIVFGLISTVGFMVMEVPTNPAVETDDPSSIVPTVAILLVEILLFVKAVVEEIIETALASTHGVQHAAESGHTPRLDS